MGLPTTAYYATDEIREVPFSPLFAWELLSGVLLGAL
jgi:hypothetical protein